jgi:hypothetical protein
MKMPFNKIPSTGTPVESQDQTKTARIEKQGTHEHAAETHAEDPKESLAMKAEAVQGKANKAGLAHKDSFVSGKTAKENMSTKCDRASK